MSSKCRLTGIAGNHTWGFLKSICDTGCVYREPSFAHLKCKLSDKYDLCVGPCSTDCDKKCYPPTKTDTKLLKHRIPPCDLE